MPHATPEARRAYQWRWAHEINPDARRRIWRHGEIAGRRRRRDRAWARSPGVCYFCHGLIYLATFVIDHLVPRARGGVDAEHNRVASCRRCNARKGAKTATEYRSWLRARGELPPALDNDGLPDWSFTEEDSEAAMMAVAR